MAIASCISLRCPLCGTGFEARAAGHSYFVSGIDTDLRETGSIEQRRHHSVCACPQCDYADFVWDFNQLGDAPTPSKQTLKDKLSEARKDWQELPEELLSCFKAQVCFEWRSMDQGSRAELELMTYHVAKDIGFSGLESLRQRAANRFAAAFECEDSPSSLSIRYAYLAGELRRLNGDHRNALKFFEQAIVHGHELLEQGFDSPDDIDLVSWSRRRRAELIHANDSSTALFAVCQVADDDVRAEVVKILARRRDDEALGLLPELYTTLNDGDRLVMLREFEQAPHPELSEIFLQGLQSENAESVRLSARCLAQLAQDLDPELCSAALLSSLERGLVATENALVEALREFGQADLMVQLEQILQRWEQEQLDQPWLSHDLSAVKNLLYLEGGEAGLERLVQDMEQLEDNDLWDKVPFGSPIPAAIRMGPRFLEVLPRLIASENPVTRRWAAHIAAEIELEEAREVLGPLLLDDDAVVRMQAAKSLAKLGDCDHSKALLHELSQLDPEELPFALHFLVEFRSTKIRDFLLGALSKNWITVSEVLPLLGRQECCAAIQDIINESLESEDEDVRASAITALAFSGQDHAEQTIRKVFKRERSETIRRRSIFGLARVAERCPQRDEIVEFLQAQFQNGDSKLRFPAALALLHLGDTTGIQVVRERAAAVEESFDHYDLVAPAIKALARYERRQAS